jgi:2-succinyl-5-enolpyruvyl-6-hydroxy-3-cyclohexene-1-carboxylate synthase
MLVEECVRCGVDTFFVAPGSRSTPLTVAAARHPRARVVLHVDERGTAFAALGHGRATGRPAGWITTSGTAVANGMPAVVEAGTDGVPMLLLTADRPPELRDTGANQTVDQVKIFGDYVRWHVDLPPPAGDVDPAYVLSTVDQAVHRSRRVPAGPVHLNCMFRKPLEPVAPAGAPDPADGAPPRPRPDLPPAVERWRNGEGPYTTYPAPAVGPGRDSDPLARALSQTGRGVVVVGRLDTGAEAEAVRRLARRLGWPILPDATSRLRLGPAPASPRIAHADLVLASDAFRRAYAPEAVLQVGGRYVSKRIRHYVRDADPTLHVVARPDPARIDPDRRATHHVETGVEALAGVLTERLEPTPDADWTEAWMQAESAVASALHDALPVAPPARSEGGGNGSGPAPGAGALGEAHVARLVTRHVPPAHALVAASSMPVRDVTRFASTAGEPVPVVANRGASGIDGTVATAAGVAHGRRGRATLLIGDLALAHDVSSLALLGGGDAERDGAPVVVVVVNNDGGGIFHFLPIREHEDVFDPYFTTPHGRSFGPVADTYGLPYANPDTPQAFVEAYRRACQSGGAALIEVGTDREANRAEHERLEAVAAAAVDEALGLNGTDPSA